MVGDDGGVLSDPEPANGGRRVLKGAALEGGGANGVSLRQWGRQGCGDAHGGGGDGDGEHGGGGSSAMG